MKRFIISIILFAVTVAACVAETFFLNNFVTSFTEEINYAIDETAAQNLESANHVAQDITNRWQEQQSFISTFINHDRLEEIAHTIISMKTFLEQGQIEDFLVESEVAKVQLNHLKDTELPTIENIL